MMHSHPNSPVDVKSSDPVPCLSPPQIYQLEHFILNAGKRQPGSKKKVLWRFVVQEADSSNSNNTTIGSSSSSKSQQYEIVLMWSFSSGKQSITVNGVQAYFGKKAGASILDVSLLIDKTQGPNDNSNCASTFNIQIIAARTKPNKSPETFRCFELLIDGKSYLDFPKRGGIENGFENGPSSTLVWGVSQFIEGVHLFDTQTYGNKKQRQQQEYDGPMSILELLYPNHNLARKDTHAGASVPSLYPPSFPEREENVDMFDSVPDMGVITAIRRSPQLLS